MTEATVTRVLRLARFLIAGSDCKSIAASPAAGATIVEAYLKKATRRAPRSPNRECVGRFRDDNVIADSFGIPRRLRQGGDDEISANGEGQQLADGGSGATS